MMSIPRGLRARAGRFRRYGVLFGAAASLAVLAFDTVVAFTPASPRWPAAAASGALAIVWIGVGRLALIDRAALAAGTRASRLAVGYVVAVAVAAVTAASGAAVVAIWRGPHGPAMPASVVAASATVVAAGYAVYRCLAIRTDLAAATYLRHGLALSMIEGPRP